MFTVRHYSFLVRPITRVHVSFYITFNVLRTLNIFYVPITVKLQVWKTLRYEINAVQ